MADRQRTTETWCRRRRELSPRRAAAFFLAGLAAAAAGLGADPARAQTGAFTREEAEDLRAGELVVRREEQARGGKHFMGGTSFQVIDLPPDAVWRAMLDTSSYRHFLPQVATTRTVARNADRRVLHVVHEQGPVRAEYFVSVSFVARSRMAQLRVDTSRPGTIREGWGFFSVQPYGRTRTIVTWGLMADIGDGLVTGFVRPRVHEWMLRVPAELKRYVEGWGRSRYVAE
jgi:carbon monoxide dehydrogenase subunit G